MQEHDPKIEAWFDGARNSETGQAAYGFLVARDGRIVFTCSAYIGNGAASDSQSAEYAGLVAVFRYLQDKGINRARVMGDSEVAIKSAQGVCRISPRYRDRVLELMSLTALMPGIELIWIRRTDNKRANDLAATALQNYMLAESPPDQAQKRPSKPAGRAPRLRRQARRFLSRIIEQLS